MVARMRRLEILVFCLAAAVAPLAVAGGAELDGVWVASLHDGSPMVWQVNGARLRINGRPADLEIRSDSLIVSFDAAPKSDPEAEREMAVYRFLASSSLNGFQRLFVYGFDLGSRGLYLEREAAEEQPLPEDTVPPVPQPVPQPKAPACSSPAPVAQARAGNR
jgi:hypothetical protein